MDTTRIAQFVAAADAGSVSGAASRLGVQVSGVSRAIADLETDLGVKLFERTGRGVRLTPAGDRFLERARQVLRELELARAEAKGTSERELTLLRLSAPPDLAQHLLPPVVATVLARFPSLSVQVRGDVRRVSLVEESYDAVIRLGPLAPSELIARKLGRISVRLYAAPGRGVARLPDLQQREAVLTESLPAELPARDRGQPVVVSLPCRVRVSSFTEAGAIAAMGGHLALLPSFSALSFITAGTLSAAARWLTFGAIDVHLLRTPRHRGSVVLDLLGDEVQRALEDVERRVNG